MNRRFQLLLHPLFLTSIFLLLINDASLKYEFPNWFTGKLSDFTGLFGLSIFLMAFFPGYQTKILIACAVFFIWWKSDLSSYFIEIWNKEIPLKVGRVVDYTDLLALLTLPVAGYLASHSKYKTITPQPALIKVICVISLFSFCFTSMPRYAMYYSDQKDEVKFYGQFNSKRSEEQILQELTDQHISYYRDSVSYFPYQYQWLGDEYYLKIKNQDSTLQWIRLPNSKDSTIYVKRKETPFYIIPVYYLDGEELRNVKISFSRTYNERKTRVQVQTFQSALYEKLQRGKLKRKCKRHFKALFR